MAYEGKPASEFVDLAIVQEHLDAAARHVSANTGPIYRATVESVMRHYNKLQFDSPLEALFWLWWHAYLKTSNHLDDILFLQPQAEVNAGGKVFRVDFLVEPIPAEIGTSPRWKPIAVELDGHAFHERTPEQVAYRDQRDRALQAAGWQVFHYSFREFTKDPGKAICEVMVIARDQFHLASKSPQVGQS